MAGGVTEAGSEYSMGCGLIFVFNLIVGTGALAMPLAFYDAGWLISIIVLAILAVMSYISATFMVETMAIANMKLRMTKRNIIWSSYMTIRLRRSMLRTSRSEDLANNRDVECIST